MLSPYVAVLRRPGALAFSAAGVVGRLPIAMESLGVVLLVSITQGAYGLAGVLASILALSAALLSPLTSRLTDRLGQARVVGALSVLQAAALVAFVAAVRAESPVAVLVLLAAASGGLQPNIGSMVRARWSAMLTGTPQLGPAFALESLLDEFIFIAGPLLAATLATAVSPGAGVLAAAVLGLVGGLWLAGQRRTQPVPVPHPGGDGRREPMGVSVPVVGLVFACLGITFGGLDVSTVAFATEQGQAWLAGVLIAVISAGSLLGGLTFGARVGGRDLPRVLLMLCAAGIVVSLALPLVHSTVVLAIAGFAAGLVVAPSLICGYTIIENLVPTSRLTESITWATAGIGVGVAVAASIAGHVIDLYGASAGFWISVVGMALAASSCALTLPRLERAWRERPAAVDPAAHDLTD